MIEIASYERKTVDYRELNEIASYEYCQDDLEDAMDRAEHYDPAESSNQSEQDEGDLEKAVGELQKWAHAWDTAPPPWVQ